MIRLVYLSSSPHLLSEEEILDILRASRRNNEQAGITGLLVYEYGNFMQVLEGPEEKVKTVMNRIKGDARHDGVAVLLQEETEQRYFPSWSMAFATSAALRGKDRKHTSDFLSRGELPASKEGEAEEVRRILKAFRSTIRPGMQE